MSTGISTDLKNALRLTGDQDLDAMSLGTTSPPYAFAGDWEASVDGLVQTTSGPYCEGDTITVEVQFTGAGSEFPRLRDDDSNYTINSSQNCTLLSQAGPTFDFSIDAGAAGSTNNEIGITFENAFSTGADVGVKQTTTFDVSAYDVTCDAATYDSTNDELTVDYTIEPCGTSDYEVDLYRDNDGSPTLAAQDTKGSTGSFSITDTNPNSGDTSDEYRIDVTDDSGNGTTVSCTITVSFPT